MSTSQFNDKHLLWWVLKAVNACRANGTRPETLLNETMWKNLGAPDWVLRVVSNARCSLPTVVRNTRLDMGDHRFSFKAKMEFHGIKDDINLDWCNWDGGDYGIDTRITAFIESVRDRGFAKFAERQSQYFEEEHKKGIEKIERAELERLKEKYEHN